MSLMEKHLQMIRQTSTLQSYTDENKEEDEIQNLSFMKQQQQQQHPKLYVLHVINRVFKSRIGSIGRNVYIHTKSVIELDNRAIKA